MLVNRAIFLESTLSREEIKPFIKNTDLLLPSIMRGQLLKLYSSHPSIKEVIIVDGVFEQYPSITHKEILWLLSQRVQIVGIGSMGALRAYELRNDGMLGYGWVYEQFLNGYIDGDDEVAVAYDPIDPVNSKTLALINFRKTAVDNKELTEHLSIIKPIHFRERTWKTLSMHLSKDVLDKFYDKYVDIKKEDVLNFFKNSVQVDTQFQRKFIPNIYFKALRLTYLEQSLIQFIRLKIQQINYIESSCSTFYKEDYIDICRFLTLSPDYTNQIASVLDKLSGVRLSQAKIKTFTCKLQSELNLHSLQSIQDLFIKVGIPIVRIKVLFENLTKLFDYFLCTLY